MKQKNASEYFKSMKASVPKWQMHFWVRSTLCDFAKGPWITNSIHGWAWKNATFENNSPFHSSAHSTSTISQLSDECSDWMRKSSEIFDLRRRKGEYSPTRLPNDVFLHKQCTSTVRRHCEKKPMYSQAEIHHAKGRSVINAMHFHRVFSVGL